MRICASLTSCLQLLMHITGFLGYMTMCYQILFRHNIVNFLRIPFIDWFKCTRNFLLTTYLNYKWCMYIKALVILSGKIFSEVADNFCISFLLLFVIYLAPIYEIMVYYPFTHFYYSSFEQYNNFHKYNKDRCMF